jgi:hypothetical protein
MNRRDFHTWGVDLPSAEFAKALAAAGALESVRTTDTVDTLVDQLGEAVNTKEGIIAWRFPKGDPLRAITKLPPAGVLAQAWSQFQTLQKKPRLEVNAYFTGENDPRLPLWILEQLSRSEVDASSVFVPISDPAVAVSWRWPLRVGLVSRASSEAFTNVFRSEVNLPEWVRRLAKVTELTESNPECDVLLLPFELRNAMLELLRLPFRIKADCTLLISDLPTEVMEAPLTMQVLRTAVQTAGVGLVTIKPDQYLNWFVDLIAELSHDRSLDVALYAASRSSRLPSPVLAASRRLIQFSRVSERAKAVARELGRPDIRDAMIEVRENSPIQRLGMSPGRHRMKDVGERLMTAADNESYSRESHMATTMADIEESRSDWPEPQSSGPVKPRFLQVKVFDLSDPKRPKHVTDRLAPEAPHAVTVRIGFADQEWLLPIKEVRFPTEKLPGDRDEHRLVVVFSEAAVLDEPQVGTITLPRFGNSTECQFYLKRLPVGTQIKARIAVYYMNRILQTGLLSGVVSSQSTSADKGIKLQIDAIARVNLSELSSAGQLDSSLLLEKSGNDDFSLLKLTHGKATVRRVDGLQNEISWFDNELAQVAYDASRFADGLKGQATVDLLRRFAQHGVLLRQFLVEDAPGGQMLSIADRIQLISVTPEARLPLEFVYDKEAPAPESKLCPYAMEALAQGGCMPSCAAGTQPPVICPLAFWGTSRVLERHRYTPESVAELQGDFTLQAEPVSGRMKLSALVQGIFAASHRVNRAVPGSVDDLSAAIKAITTKDAPVISDWEQWKSAIRNNNPSLLFLIVHTEPIAPGDPMQRMEIGQGAWLGVANVDASHVREPAHKPPPIVFLLGCETGAPQTAFLGFVSRFRNKGAAIVISTGSAIHAAHAVQVLKAFIDALGSLTGDREVSFGDVMKEIRCRLLAKGLPMVLCLTSYGDADWKLVK